MGERLTLWLVTDRAQIEGKDLVAVLDTCLDAGLPAIQVREKDLGAGELAALCRRLVPLTRARRAVLAVNDRVDVALAVGADAVQRTSTSLAIPDIRAVAGTRLRIGASVHSTEEAADAERAGADWVVFGPVYDTPSKRRYGAPQGLVKLRETSRAVRIPVIAIGGISPERVGEVIDAGARGIAVISAILGAACPADATRELLEALESKLRAG
ncbi:MAG: thiamine phosphate synthase [Candidatus Rokubacteria bacterium]|nr:thiamine phosphate synthase [Candidatus Rokubacteria bacterium]